MSVCFRLLDMYRFVIFTYFAVAVLVDGIEIEKCKKLLDPDVLSCCTGFLFDKIMNSDTVECNEVPMDPNSCTQELCIATKKGFAAADGTIDKVKLDELMTKKFEGEAEVLEAIKNNCIYGDLDPFGPLEFCDLLKLKNCMLLQFITKCPEWNDQDNCKGKKETVEICGNFFLM